MPAGSLPRDSTWKLSRHSPSAGWPARRTIRHEWSYVLTNRPHASASYAIRMPRSAARSASRCSCSAARSSSSTASGDTEEQTSIVSDAELGHHVELVLRAPQVGGEHVRRHGLEVAERLVEVDRQAEVGAPLADLLRRPRRGDEVVLEDLHAVEARPRPTAASLSSSVPDRQTVAMPSRSDPGRTRRLLGRVVEVAQHPVGVRRAAGEQAERVGGLEDRHPAAVEDPAASLAGGQDQCGVERPVDDVGHPQPRVEQVGAAAAGQGERSCRSGSRGPARRRRRARRRATAPATARSPSRPASAAARVGVAVEHPDGPGAQVQRARARRPRRPRQRRAGRPGPSAASGRPGSTARAKPVVSVLWPTARPSRSTTVFTAPRVGRLRRRARRGGRARAACTGG